MTTENTKPVIRFRNYVPHDATLKEKKEEKDTEQLATDATAPTSSSSSSEPPAAAAVNTTNSKRKREEVDVIKQELALHTDEDLNIVPKKPNWDLKSQVEDRIQKLKRRTQRAIVDLLREKLAADAADNDDE